jgi:taurine dioxygenase
LISRRRHPAAIHGTAAMARALHRLGAHPEDQPMTTTLAAPMQSSRPFTLRTLKPGFAMEVSDVDIRTAPPAVLREIVDIYRRHSALVVRGQVGLTPDELAAFAAEIGELVPQAREEQTLPTHSVISVLSNKVVDGARIGIHWNGLGWHTDGTYLQRPLVSTLLYGVETPPEGGDTLLADTCSAYDALSAEKQQELESVEVLHSFAYLSDKQTRSINRPPASAEQLAAFPDRTHPLVWTNEHSGRKSFYLTGGTTKGVTGMSDDEGRQLIGDLIKFTTQDQFIYRHKWTQGDILIWNDLYTMHSATLYDDKKYERLVYRIWMR